MRKLTAFMALLTLCWAASLPARAGSRLALVIGEDAYEQIAPLRKAVADARGYAAALREKGYSVSEGYDVKTFDLEAKVAAFIEAIQPGDTAVFVYSGHGWSDGAQNYIVGIDAPATASQEFLAKISLPIKNDRTGILDDMERKGAGLKVAIIDACRDNPFAPPPGSKGFPFKRGFAPMPPPPTGTFVIFSAGAGESALDRLSEADADPNSVFTRIFLPLLRADLTLQDAIKASQANVVRLSRASGVEQKPAYYDEVIGPACLSATCKTAAQASPPPSDGFAEAFIDVASADQLAAMIDRLPEDVLKERAARARLAALKPAVASLEAKPATGPSTSLARAYAMPAGAELTPQLAHTYSVNSVTYSPDGRTIASGGSRDHTIKLWEASSGKLLRTLVGHTDDVSSVAYSPDGRSIASASYDHTIRLWEVKSGGKLLRMFERHTFRVRSVAFSPDGRAIAAGGDDGTIKLWEVSSGKLSNTLEGHSDSVSAVAYSPDGRSIASAGYDRAIKLWDPLSGKLLRTWRIMPA